MAGRVRRARPAQGRAAERLTAREEELARRRAAFRGLRRGAARGAGRRAAAAAVLLEAAERSDHAAREEFRATLARQRAEFDAAVRRAGGRKGDHYHDHTAGGALRYRTPFLRFVAHQPAAQRHGGLGHPQRPLRGPR